MSAAQPPILGRLLDLPGCRKAGAGWVARCPAHDDRQPSLSFRLGDDGRVLLKCHAGCEPERIAGVLGCDMAGLYPPEEHGALGRQPSSRLGRILAVYRYEDEDGTLLFEVERRDPKAFWQRVPRQGGGYSYGRQGVRGVPYRLPAVIASGEMNSWVLVAEGEKDCDRLADAGFVATCASGGVGGAAAWEDAAFRSPLAGRHVAVLADNDAAGTRCAHRIASALHGTARDVRVISFPELPPKGDVSDWLDLGNRAEDLKGRIRAAPAWTPALADAALCGLDPAPEPDPSATTGAEEPWPEPVPLQSWPRPEWPAGIFPAPLEEYRLALAEALQVPGALPGQLLLGLLAVACQRKFEITVGPDWTEPLCLFLAVVLPSGEKKSPAFSAVFATVREWERHARTAAEPEIAAARERRELAESRQRRLRGEASRLSGDDARMVEAEALTLASELAGETYRVPALPRLIADDATPEALAELLRDHEGRIAIVSAEPTTLSHMLGLYRDGGVVNHGTWLKGHAGEDVLVSRMGRSIDVPAAVLTICIGIQPDAALKVWGDPVLRDRGMVARIAVAWPVSRVGRRRTDAPAVPASVTAAYRAVARDLLDLPAERDGQGFLVPAAITFAPQASAYLATFMADVEPRLGEAGDLAGIQSWANKSFGLVARIAGLLHVADCRSATPPRDPRRQPVSADAVARAVELVEAFFVPHALALAGESAASGTVSLARRCLDWIRDHGEPEFSVRDLYRQRLCVHVPQPPDLHGPLDLLAEFGYVRLLGSDGAAKRGRPASRRFSVNPAVLVQRPSTELPEMPIEPDSGNSVSGFPPDAARATVGRVT